MSREVVGLTLDSSRLSSGEVGINWNILERNDGGVVQIVYSGDEKVEIAADAVLEGQPEIVRLQYARPLSTPSEQYTRQQAWPGRILGYAMLATGILVLAMSGLRFLRRHQRGLQKSDWIFFLQSPLMIGASIWMIFYEGPPGPPFGF